MGHMKMEISDKNYANNQQIIFCWAYHWFIRGLVHKAEKDCKAGRGGRGVKEKKMEKKQDPLLVNQKMAGFIQRFTKTLPKVFR